MPDSLEKSARGGRVAWGAIALVGALAIGGAGVHRWNKAAEARGFGWIEPNRLTLLPPSVVPDGAGGADAPWIDPRWGEEAARRLAELPRFRADDAEARLDVTRILAGLSFVESAAFPEVIWPDGLRVPIRLRRPIACVAVAGEFFAVDRAGVLLTGRWDAPPRRDGGWLPLVRVDGVDTSPVEQDLDAGLATAASFWKHVEEERREPFGRFVIDATRARDGEWASGGVQLVFEDGRSATFGRPPHVDAPGELPAANKWASLENALALRPPGGATDWESVDVRWDRPELSLRSGATSGDSDDEDPEGGVR